MQQLYEACPLLPGLNLVTTLVFGLHGLDLAQSLVKFDVLFN